MAYRKRSTKSKKRKSYSKSKSKRLSTYYVSRGGIRL